MRAVASLLRRELIIFGAGGHATSVAEVAFSAGFKVRCFIDKDRRGSLLLSIPVVAENDVRFGCRTNANVAIGDNAVRERVIEQVRLFRGDARFPPLIHRTASVSRYAVIGEGSVVMQNASIGSGANIGSFCIVNTGASVDHDCIMKDFSSVAPGAAVGGHVSIGNRSAVSIGAVIRHGSTIGDDSVLGANSYLHGNLGSLMVAYGSPARVVRPRTKGERYL